MIAKPDRSTPRRTGAAQPPRRGSARAVTLAAVVLLLAIAAWAWMRIAPQAPRPASGTARDSAAALDGATALDQALARVRRGQPRLSLPFFERALATSGALPPRIVLPYAAALQDAGLDARVGTSLDRQRWLAAADRLLDRAARAAPSSDAAALDYRRAYLLRVVGFPLESVEALTAAIAADSTTEDYRLARDAMIERLRHPEDPAR